MTKLTPSPPLLVRKGEDSGAQKSNPSLFKRGERGELLSLTGKRAVVIGLGRSGLAAALRLVKAGASVLVSESKNEITPEVLEQLSARQIEWESGGHTLAALEKADLVVVSPGVHLDLPPIVEAKKRGLPVISEVELAYHFLTKPLIAITGTNGKTTTTTLLGEILRAAGKKVAVAGNIGEPLSLVDDQGLDYVIAEISSYQLETTQDFHPWISVILNIQPDHLERHHSLENYIREKEKIFANQIGDDYLVYNADDPAVVKMAKKAKARLIPFSQNDLSIITLAPEKIKIRGRHNLENALAAASVATLCGTSSQTIAQVLADFPGVEHRIEEVAVINGVTYINDSKGTNPDSTLVAIETFKAKGIILLLGGREKGVDLTPLISKIKSSVKAVVLLGEAEAKFANALQAAGYQNFYRSGPSLERALKQAAALASPGEVVLFSPACASFDMFNNYEERGRAFKNLVRGVAGS